MCRRDRVRSLFKASQGNASSESPRDEGQRQLRPIRPVHHFPRQMSVTVRTYFREWDPAELRSPVIPSVCWRWRGRSREASLPLSNHAGATRRATVLDPGEVRAPRRRGDDGGVRTVHGPADERPASERAGSASRPPRNGPRARSRREGRRPFGHLARKVRRAWVTSWAWVHSRPWGAPSMTT